ncbi:MAG: PilZ domain-containing protein [Acidobacteriota bacterium]
MAISTSSAASVHIHEDDLLLFAEGTLEETLSAAIADHVELCPECRQQLSSIARFRREYYQATTAIDERRREHRIQTNDPAMLRMLNPLVGKLMVIRVVDVSKNGAKLHTPIAIPVGGLVQVRVRQSIILGEVRYCVTVRGQFYSGIRIQGLHQFRLHRDFLTPTIVSMTTPWPATFAAKSATMARPSTITLCAVAAVEIT